MSTFFAFETEWRLIRIGQSFGRLSLRCKQCDGGMHRFIWISNPWVREAPRGAAVFLPPNKKEVMVPERTYFDANSLLRSTAGVAAARARRSKLSASSKTAFLALGSVNCPATSRACSARSSHSKASFKIDGIWSSLILRSSFVFVSLRLPARKVGAALPRLNRGQRGDRQPYRTPKPDRQKQCCDEPHSWGEPSERIAWQCVLVRTLGLTAPENSRVVRPLR